MLKQQDGAAGQHSPALKKKKKNWLYEYNTESSHRAFKKSVQWGTAFGSRGQVEWYYCHIYTITCLLNYLMTLPRKEKFKKAIFFSLQATGADSISEWTWEF